MKILKIFGIVVGIHVFALVLIFANPGCSSTATPAAPADTAARVDAPPITSPNVSPARNAATGSGTASSAVTFNPDAPAVAPSSSDSGGVRYVPTRPGAAPVATSVVSEPVVDVQPATTYTVKAGDNLWTVAKKNHVTVAELTGANSLPANPTLRPGQKLLIPGKPASPSAAPTASGAPNPAPKTTDLPPGAATASRTPGEAMKHVVKSGESLSTIARFYGVKQGDIAVANNISDPAKIKAGDQLIIPGYQTPVSKAGKATKSGGTKSGDAKSNPAASESPAPAPATPPPVPIIKIDESPLTPAPKL
jgi:LysM repeat protein